MTWDVLVPLDERSEVLEIGPEGPPFGSLEDAPRPAASGGTPTGGHAFDVVVWSGGPDAAPSWGALEEAAASVRPGGYLWFQAAGPFWGAWNPLRRILQGIAARREAAGGGGRSPLADLAPETLRLPRAAPRACRRRLGALGFDRVELYQWFPSHRRRRYSVPLDHRGAVDYFLSHLVPRRGRAAAALLGAARLANRLGLYRALVPVYGVLARKGGDAHAGGAV